MSSFHPKDDQVAIEIIDTVYTATAKGLLSWVLDGVGNTGLPHYKTTSDAGLTGEDKIVRYRLLVNGEQDLTLHVVFFKEGTTKVRKEEVTLRYFIQGKQYGMQVKLQLGSLHELIKQQIDECDNDKIKSHIDALRSEMSLPDYTEDE